MVENIDIISKVIIPTLTLIITFWVALRGWLSSRYARFEEREKLSKHAYEMYMISGDDKLKNLSLEYGYAAITRESFLNVHQRKALVGSKNPTRDIDDFIKCRDLLDIKIKPLRFEWKKSRIKNRWYYNFLMSMYYLVFIMGVLFLITPLILTMFSIFLFGIDFLAQPIWQVIGLTSYFFALSLLSFSLSKRSISRMSIASNLIKRHY